MISKALASVLLFLSALFCTKLALDETGCRMSTQINRLTFQVSCDPYTCAEGESCDVEFYSTGNLWYRTCRCEDMTEPPSGDTTACYPYLVEWEDPNGAPVRIINCTTGNCTSEQTCIKEYPEIWVSCECR